MPWTEPITEPWTGLWREARRAPWGGVTRPPADDREAKGEANGLVGRWGADGDRADDDRGPLRGPKPEAVLLPLATSLSFSLAFSLSACFAVGLALCPAPPAPAASPSSTPSGGSRAAASRAAAVAPPR